MSRYIILVLASLALGFPACRQQPEKPAKALGVDAGRKGVKRGVNKEDYRRHEERLRLEEAASDSHRGRMLNDESAMEAVQGYRRDGRRQHQEAARLIEDMQKKLEGSFRGEAGAREPVVSPPAAGEAGEGRTGR